MPVRAGGLGWHAREPRACAARRARAVARACARCRYAMRHLQRRLRGRPARGWGGSWICRRPARHTRWSCRSSERLEPLMVKMVRSGHKKGFLVCLASRRRVGPAVVLPPSPAAGGRRPPAASRPAAGGMCTRRTRPKRTCTRPPCTRIPPPSHHGDDWIPSLLYRKHWSQTCV